jgi:hypothetical protein
VISVNVSEWNMSPNKVGRILRLEPEGIELLEACLEIRQKFVQGEWFKFCCAFQGHHEEISMLFAKNFDGFQTQVGDVIIHVTEHSIVATCRFPVKGER